MSCGICLDNFIHPIALPCGHVFCKTCITSNNLVSKTEEFEIVYKIPEQTDAPAACRLCPHCREPYPYYDEPELNKRHMQPVFFYQPEPVISDEQHKQWVREMACRATAIDRANSELQAELEALKKDYAYLKTCMESVSKDNHKLAQSNRRVKKNNGLLGNGYLVLAQECGELHKRLGDSPAVDTDNSDSHPETDSKGESEPSTSVPSVIITSAMNEKPVRPARSTKRKNPTRRLSQITVVAPIIVTEQRHSPDRFCESPNGKVNEQRAESSSLSETASISLSPSLPSPAPQSYSIPACPTPSHTDGGLKRSGTLNLKPRLGLLLTFRRKRPEVRVLA